MPSPMASSASSLSSLLYMRTPFGTPWCPTIRPHPHLPGNALASTFSRPIRASATELRRRDERQRRSAGCRHRTQADGAKARHTIGSRQRGLSERRHGGQSSAQDRGAGSLVENVRSASNRRLYIADSGSIDSGIGVNACTYLNSHFDDLEICHNLLCAQRTRMRLRLEVWHGNDSDLTFSTSRCRTPSFWNLINRFG